MLSLSVMRVQVRTCVCVRAAATQPQPQQHAAALRSFRLTRAARGVAPLGRTMVCVGVCDVCDRLTHLDRETSRARTAAGVSTATIG